MTGSPRGHHERRPRHRGPVLEPPGVYTACVPWGLTAPDAPHDTCRLGTRDSRRSRREQGPDAPVSLSRRPVGPPGCPMPEFRPEAPSSPTPVHCPSSHRWPGSKPAPSSQPLPTAPCSQSAERAFATVSFRRLLDEVLGCPTPGQKLLGGLWGRPGTDCVHRAGSMVGLTSSAKGPEQQKGCV